MKIMPKKLSDKDIRAIKIGAILMACITVFLISSSWVESWRCVRKSIMEKQTKLKQLASSSVKQAGVFAIVPVFEMPQAEETQKFLFRNKLNEQLKKIGIKSEPLEIFPNKKGARTVDYKLVSVKCSSEKCSFNQILDLLAALVENPYLAGIEELNIKCDPKSREIFKLDIVVSTFVK